MTTGSRNIKPHPLLREYIECYTIRKIQFSESTSMEKIMPQRAVCSLDFFLGTPHQKIDYQTNENVPFRQATIRGMRTYPKYKIQLGGNFISLTVRFRVTGMYRLFGIPVKYLTNEDMELKTLGILPAEEILEKLCGAKSEREYVPIVEAYLLNIVRNRIFPSRLSHIRFPQTHFIHNRRLLVNEVSNKINLSTRQTERLFLEEIGLPLRKINLLHKFDYLIKDKIAHPEKSWTELGYEYGFYDSADLFKAFKTFLDTTPSQFDASKFAF